MRGLHAAFGGERNRGNADQPERGSQCNTTFCSIQQSAWPKIFHSSEQHNFAGAAVTKS